MKWRKDKVVETLLDIKRMFRESEPRHYLNRIYIDDFCVFVEKVEDDVFDKVKGELNKLEIEKKDLGLGI